MRHLIPLSLFVFASTLLAQQVPEHGGSAELQRIKGLSGTWTGTADHGNGPESVTLVYRVTGGGSAVVETYNPDTPMEMVTVYHDRDGKLEMTHYCMLGNQPHMKLKEVTDKSLSLELVKNSGIKEKEMHMSSLTIEFKSADRIHQVWTVSVDGKSRKSPPIELTRQH